MIAQYRPDIARAAEQAVVNIKELENRLEALRNDLAWLCQGIGHPEAARLAVTPARLTGIGAAQGIALSPHAALAAGTGVFAPNLAPGSFGSPASWGVGAPLAWAPGFSTGYPTGLIGATNPYAGFIGVNPYANVFAGNFSAGVSPFMATQPFY